jgi:hypothetical protein
MQLRNRSLILGTVLALVASAPAWSGSHTWETTEVYSKDATGTIEFFEVWEYAAGAAENAVAGHIMSSPTKTYTIPTSVGGNTAGKFLLFATAGFAALPGAPAPDYLIPAGSTPFFLATGAAFVKYNGAQAPNPLTWTAGQLPTNGVDSLNIPLTPAVGPVFTAPASPTNYAGATFAPPGTAGLKVAKVTGFPNGDRLSLSWNTGVCLGAAKYQIAYGLGSQLPTVLGGTYGLQPAVPAAQCAITASPKLWSGVPDPGADPKHFLWFSLIATNGTTTEGSLGKDSAGGERNGPSAGGKTGQCSMTLKSVVNTCQ